MTISLDEHVARAKAEVWREAARRCLDVPNGHLPDYFNSIADEADRAAIAAVHEREGAAGCGCTEQDHKCTDGKFHAGCKSQYMRERAAPNPAESMVAMNDAAPGELVRVGWAKRPPDPAEAMRAECEAIAEDCAKWFDDEGSRGTDAAPFLKALGAKWVKNAIAAIKEN